MFGQVLRGYMSSENGNEYPLRVSKGIPGSLTDFSVWVYRPRKSNGQLVPDKTYPMVRPWTCWAWRQEIQQMPSPPSAVHLMRLPDCLLSCLVIGSGRAAVQRYRSRFCPGRGGLRRQGDVATHHLKPLLKFIWLELVPGISKMWLRDGGRSCLYACIELGEGVGRRFGNFTVFT